MRFKNTEQLPDVPLERKVIFDISCVSTTGECFVVEMRKAKINFFKDRALFYVTFPIRDQAQRGEWAFRLEPIFHKAFKTAELANLNREQYSAYEQNLLDYWGVKAAVDTARDEGRVEGDHAARLAVERNLLRLLSVEVISQRTNLTVDEVVRLSDKERG